MILRSFVAGIDETQVKWDVEDEQFASAVEEVCRIDVRQFLAAGDDDNITS